MNSTTPPDLVVQSSSQRRWNILFQHIPAASRSLFILLFFIFLTTPALHAIHDTNHNGVSDLWEKKFNQGELYPTFDPAADPDGDGSTNAQEATAGTDPTSGVGLTGLVRPDISYTPAVYRSPEEDGAEPQIDTPGFITITWPTLPGKKYSLLSSIDLTGGSWTSYGRPSIGTGTAISTTIQLNQSDDSNPTASFWRVIVNDTDSDADALTDSEEIEIGSSANFADTNDDGEDDATAYAAGRNPAATDTDCDGVPDNELYSVEFEVTEEEHSLDYNRGYRVLAGASTTYRYLTKKYSEEYSITGSPTYPTLTNGNLTYTYAFVTGGIFLRSGEPKSQAEGISFDDWKRVNYQSAGPDVTITRDAEQVSVTGPTITETESITKKTTTCSWKSYRSIAVAPYRLLVQSGTETSVVINREKLSDPITYQEMWTNYLKTSPRSDWGLIGPHLIGPHNWKEYNRTVFGDKVAANYIRDRFNSGDFGGLGTVSSLGINENDTGYEYQLKSLRWRWVRFNPLTPFDYQYAAPPASYQKSFHLFVKHSEHTYNRRGESQDFRKESPKGIISIECQGSEGAGWHAVAPSKFAAYKLEDPTNQAELSFFRNGGSGVGFGTLPIQTVSRDKFLAGSFDVPYSWNKLELEIIGPDGSLGKSSDLLGIGSTKIYDKVEDVLKASDYANGCQPATQKVWFVRDAPGSRKINFYTCLNRVGAVKVILYKDGDPQPLEINHTLTPAPDFAGVIRYVNEWVKGTSFDFGGGTGPLGLRSSNRSISATEEIDYLTSACLITFFNTIQNVEGLTGVVIGLFDGIKAGLIDDKKFIEFIVSNVAEGGTYSYLEAKAELELWRTDPLKRATEMANLSRQFVQDVVFKKFETTRKKLSTWNGFRDEAWNHLKRVGALSTVQYTVPVALWPTIVDGYCEWNTDFNSRMLLGGEKTAFIDTAWVKTKLIASGTDPTVFDVSGAAIRTFGYTAGYSSGYIVEQVAVGALTVQAGNLAKAALKGGISLASNLSHRTAFAVSSRSHLLKRWLAGAAVSIEMEVAAARGLADAGRSPISSLYREIPGEAIEQTMRRPAYDRTLFNLRLVGEEVAKCPRLQALFLIEQTEARFWTATGKFVRSLGEETSAAAMKGWVKAYDRCLKIEGGALLDDRADDLFKLVKIETVEGQKALRKSLEEFGATDGSGKFWLRNVEKIQAEGYRYSNFEPPNGWASFNGEFPTGEWYCTFDKFTSPGVANDSLLLSGNTANPRYRFEFRTDTVKERTRIARGKNDTASIFEPITKDIPIGPNVHVSSGTGLNGSSSQFIVEGTLSPYAVWDMTNGTKVWPSP